METPSKSYPTPEILRIQEQQEAVARVAIQNFTRELSHKNTFYVDFSKLYREEAERLEEID